MLQVMHQRRELEELEEDCGYGMYLWQGSRVVQWNNLSHTVGFQKYGAVEMHGTLGYQHWRDTSMKFNSSP